MSQLVEIKVPDIGDFNDVPVIELFVKVGDALAVDDAVLAGVKSGKTFAESAAAANYIPKAD